MKSTLLIAAALSILLPATARSDEKVIPNDKAELMGRVEGFFLFP